MNLHGIAAPLVGLVNPFVDGQLVASTGSTINADYSATPGYAAAVPLKVQKQDLSFKDLQHVNNLNLQGELCAIYCLGMVRAVNRENQTGGDKIVIGADTWLAVAIAEQWPDWVRVIGQKQVNP